MFNQTLIRLFLNIMNIWKNYITAGNEQFAKNEFESARALYEAARREAEILFPSWRDPHEAVSALVVSYHNMADLHQKQGETSAARGVLEAIHQRVLRAVTSTPIYDRRHSALYRGSIETYSALLTHKRCHLLVNTH